MQRILLPEDVICDQKVAGKQKEKKQKEVHLDLLERRETENGF